MQYFLSAADFFTRCFPVMHRLMFYPESWFRFWITPEDHQYLWRLLCFFFLSVLEHHVRIKSFTRLLRPGTASSNSYQENISVLLCCDDSAAWVMASLWEMTDLQILYSSLIQLRPFIDHFMSITFHSIASFTPTEPDMQRSGANFWFNIISWKLSSAEERSQRSVCQVSDGKLFH